MKQEAVMELAPEATAERKAVDERGGAKEAVNAVEEGTVAVEEVKVGEGAELDSEDKAVDWAHA